MSDKRIPIRLREMFFGEAWAITEEGLAKIAAILNRDFEELQTSLLAEAARCGIQGLTIEELAARRSLPMENTHAVERYGPNGCIAVIPIEGPLFPKANLFTQISGATSMDLAALDLTAAVEDRATRAVVLRTNGPGGTVEGTGEFARMVRSFSGTKPIVSYVPHIAGSATYHIACAADELHAYRAASVGSIGTVVKAIQDKARDGEFMFVSAQSPYKRVALDSDEGKARVQQLVNDLADVFIADVAEYRGVTAEKVSQDFGQGDLLIASKALAVGMIDSTTTFEALIADLIKRTGSASGSITSGRLFARATSTITPPAGAKEKSTMTTQDNGTQDHEALLARVKELEAQAATDAAALAAEARTRIDAEVSAFRAPLLAKDDMRFNAQTVNLYGHLLTVAKSAAAGLTSAELDLGEAGKRTVALDAKSLGAFVAEQVTALTKAANKFVPPTNELPADKRTDGALTRADFEAANAGDQAASARIDSAVRAAIDGDLGKYRSTFDEMKKKALAAAA